MLIDVDGDSTACNSGSAVDFQALNYIDFTGGLGTDGQPKSIHVRLDNGAGAGTCTKVCSC